MPNRLLPRRGLINRLQRQRHFNDDEVCFQEPVAGTGGLKLVVGENLKREMKPAIQFVLPLFGQTARTDDQAALQVASGDQFFHQQAGHDCFARPGVIGEQEAQRLAWQHRVVDCCDLVGQWLYDRGMDREHWIEQVRQPYSVGFGNQPEKGAVAVEAPRPALLRNLDSWLIVSIEEFVGYLAGWSLIREF